MNDIQRKSFRKNYLSEIACPYILRENHISFAPPCMLKNAESSSSLAILHRLRAAISLCEGTYILGKKFHALTKVDVAHFDAIFIQQIGLLVHFLV